MDNVESLKTGVRASRSRLPDTGLTYSQHLEAACRLVFGAKSLNHFMAEPGHFSRSLPSTILEVLHRIQKCESLLADLPVDDVIPGYERLDQWEIAASIWAGSLGQGGQESSLVWLLRHTDEFADLPHHGTLTEAGEVVSIFDERLRVEPETLLGFIFQAWLPQKEGPGRALLIELWDQLEYAAIANGYNADDAHYFRSVCRESYNHSWSVRSMVLLGVLDAAPLRGSFLTRFSCPEKAVETMRAIWEEEEPF